MFAIRVTSHEYGGLAQFLHRLDDDLPWSILAERVAAVILEDHHEAFSAGIDAFGEALDPIKPATAQRRKRAGKGNGPPLAPDAPEGRIADASAEVDPRTDGADILISWPVAPFLHFHRDGSVPGTFGPRDVVGIRPATWDKIAVIVRDFCREFITGAH